TSPEGSLQITRDAAGNVTQRSYSDGLVVNFTYDLDNRLTGGTGVSFGLDPDGRIISCNGLVVTRDAAGRIVGITYAAGKAVNYSYNNRGLLAQVSDWAGGSISLSYDDAHRLVSMSRANGVT